MIHCEGFSTTTTTAAAASLCATSAATAAFLLQWPRDEMWLHHRACLGAGIPSPCPDVYQHYMQEQYQQCLLFHSVEARRSSQAHFQQQLQQHLRAAAVTAEAQWRYQQLHAAEAGIQDARQATAAVPMAERLKLQYQQRHWHKAAAASNTAQLGTLTASFAAGCAASPAAGLFTAGYPASTITTAMESGGCCSGCVGQLGLITCHQGRLAVGADEAGGPQRLQRGLPKGAKDILQLKKKGTTLVDKGAPGPS